MHREHDPETKLRACDFRMDAKKGPKQGRVAQERNEGDSLLVFGFLLSITGGDPRKHDLSFVSEDSQELVWSEMRI
eukprot:1389549-Rhodomonas_salina.1